MRGKVGGFSRTGEWRRKKMNKIDLKHDGVFYLYASGGGSGYGFPVRVSTLAAFIDVALDMEGYKFKLPLETVEIRISGGKLWM